MNRPPLGTLTARWAAVLLLALVVRQGLFPLIRADGVILSAFGLLVVVTGLTGGPVAGATAGFVLGLVMDLFAVTPFGLGALAYSLIGFGCGWIGARNEDRWPPAQMVLTGIAAAAAPIVYASIGALVGQHQLLAAPLGRIAIVQGIWGFVLALPLRRLVRWCLGARGGPLASAVRAPASEGSGGESEWR
jgi:rod shape-determining protein MreD